MSGRLPSEQEMETLLAHFRDSVRHWSERQSGADPPVQWKPAAKRRNRAGAFLGWGFAVAALALAIAVPVRKNANQRQREADALLVEQVDAQISRPVPAPLEPLMKLIAWEPVSGKGEIQ